MSQSIPALVTDAPPRGFCNLPEEILLLIIKNVHKISLHEQKELVEKRWERITRLAHLGSDPPASLWTHSLQGPEILSTFQSFSVVNREIYRLCRPLLWQTIEFPSILPIAMGYWTTNLLEKHGKLVNRLHLTLSNDWLNSSPFELLQDLIAAPYEYQYSLLSPIKMIKDEDVVVKYLSENGTDNLILIDLLSRPKPQADIENISYHNTKKVLLSCPNIATLVLSCPDISSLRYRSERESCLFPSRIAALLSGTSGIRHLEISGTNGCNVYTKLVVQISGALPLLETFQCSEVAPEDDGDDETFGRAISRLDHLESLSMDSVCSFNCVWDRMWDGWSGLPKLVKLDMKSCGNVSVIEGAWTMNSFPRASNLTHLTLSFYEDDRADEYWEADGSLHPYYTKLSETLFKLPALVELELWRHGDLDLLPLFRDCQSLRRLTYLDIPAHEWSALRTLICASTWPLLDSLSIFPATDSDHDHANVAECKAMLRDHCERSGVKLVIF